MQHYRLTMSSMLVLTAAIIGYLIASPSGILISFFGAIFLVKSLDIVGNRFKTDVDRVLEPKKNSKEFLELVNRVGLLMILSMIGGTAFAAIAHTPAMHAMACGFTMTFFLAMIKRVHG